MRFQTCRDAVWAAEIKSARTVSDSETKGLQRLAAMEGGNFQSGIVFYDGDSMLPRSSRMVADHLNEALSR